jgi:Tfp pilus assembly protein PilV
MRRQINHPKPILSAAGSRRGITLIEVSISTLLVGLIVVSSLRCLAMSAQSSGDSLNRTLATLLAEDLMEEILEQDYFDPDDTPVFGTEAQEGTSDRSDWDDVDDYDGWTASPPQNGNGVSVQDAKWKRLVIVQHVSADNLNTVLADTNDAGVKRITVTVQCDGETVVEVTAIQTEAWISMIPTYGTSTTTGQLPPANEAPTAIIGSHTMTGTSSVSVTFDAGTSSDPEGRPLEFEWDFGTGSTATGSNVSYTFTNVEDTVSVFSITLTVKDIHGGSDTATSTVTVYPSI